ncbi:hypothetical protein [Neopusillimonas aromaticivorans]|uniref:hypothetical protein n=1 Tax=Neopusillimonas aromaticivorans TaxID=2979868 RepID=UPI0025931B8C|nr:hypothetical protein [Neopusillimonas aromaticivorans]WJJ93041.1 hypothetical protein N7E01_13060 [Neopusillimonas aromaticivorans]
MAGAAQPGVEGTLDLLKLLVSSPRNWVEQTFRDPRLHAALATWGCTLILHRIFPVGPFFRSWKVLPGRPWAW